MQLFNLVTVFVLAHFGACLCCDPGPFVEKHEGRKSCVYLNTEKIKTIGVGYNMENKGAPDDFESIDADYQKFTNGPATPWNVKCNCTAVPCLSDEQVDQLFSLSLRTATSDAQAVIPNFSTLCCSVQNVMVDMAFTLGRARFVRFSTFAKLIFKQEWRAAADELALSEWCAREAEGRCSDAANAVAVGCGCAEPTPQACDAQGSVCCPPVSNATCCKAGIATPRGYFANLDEFWCCPLPSAYCCPDNKCCDNEHPVCCPNSRKCCASQYPVCCPDNDICCPEAYPVCKDGRCYSSRDSTTSEGMLGSISKWMAH